MLKSSYASCMRAALVSRDRLQMDLIQPCIYVPTHFFIARQLRERRALRWHTRCRKFRKSINRIIDSRKARPFFTCEIPTRCLSHLSHMSHCVFAILFFLLRIGLYRSIGFSFISHFRTTLAIIIFARSRHYNYIYRHYRRRAPW